MAPSDVADKTARGLQEVKARALKLPPRLRTMLIMVDGTQTVAQLQDAARVLGAPEDFLERLVDSGLISFRPAGRSGTGLASSPRKSGPTEPVPEPVPEPEPEPVLGTEVERFMAAQKFMNDTVVDALGFRAFFFTLKLERCYNRSDLRQLLGEYVRVISKSSGAAAAKVLQERVEALLA